MTARLARALLVEAARSLPLLDGRARDQALAAVDAFVAAPAPSSYLRAARVLVELRRQARGDAELRTLAARSFQRGLERVAATPALHDDAVDALAALPIDARAGRRLDALATLVAAHQELAARVRQADATRRPLQPEVSHARVTRVQTVLAARRRRR